MKKEKSTSADSRTIRWINRLCLVILALAIPTAIFIAASGKGLTDGSFGPAAYYYTDIPEWQEVFYGEDETGIEGVGTASALVISITAGGLLLWALKRLNP